MTLLRLLLVASLLSHSACTGERLLDAPPASQVDAARIPGYEKIRFSGTRDDLILQDAAKELTAQIRARIKDEGKRPNNGIFDVLVLSGGGSDGAFGAGLLQGWSERGDRPEFGIVTGISTGALIAPFAFLGSEYDDELRRLYTQTATKDIVSFAILEGLFGAPGLTDPEPLRLALAREITPEVVELIGIEHLKGRRLWVGTSNLDTQRPVIWDLGAIAITGRKDAPELIREIILASASIPGAFPPVFFTVEANGRRYAELHVDGGVTRQLFLFPQPDAVQDNVEGVEPDRRGAMRRGTVYAIRNSKLGPDFSETPAGILEIAERSLSTLLKYSGNTDLLLLRTQADAAGFKIKIVGVPKEFDVKETELFDPIYMNALFTVGEEMGQTGVPWR
ncbi:MAG: patatin-like phospholipase family protein [Pseudomonadota bacterium]